MVAEHIAQTVARSYGSEAAEAQQEQLMERSDSSSTRNVIRLNSHKVHHKTPAAVERAFVLKVAPFFFRAVCSC